MRRAWTILGLFVGVAVVLNVTPVATAPHLGVTICHRTGSTGHPFVVITPDNQSIIEAHIGPIAHPDKNGNSDLLLPFPNATVEQCKQGDGGGDGGGGDGGGGDVVR